MISQNQRAFICGLKGYKITKSEKAFLVKHKPWGVILFSRNIKSIKQTQLLTQSLKTISKNPNFPILIDEEDGLSISFDQWRFNLRGSNTEPFVRLNVEAKNDKLLLNTKVEELKKIIIDC